MGVKIDAVKLALKHRQAIASGEFAPFIQPLAFAMADDALFDPILTIPIVGLVVALPSAAITIYLFIFLFGKGTWKIRLLVFGLQVLDWFPVVNLLPMSTVSVLYVYYQAKKKADQSRKELGVLEVETKAQMRRDYLSAQAQIVAEEQEQVARNQATEAANDRQYRAEAISVARNQSWEAANDQQYEREVIRKVA